MFAVIDAVAQAPGERVPTPGDVPMFVSESVMVASVDRRSRTGALPAVSPTLHTVTGSWMALFGKAEGGAVTV
jgi:hypothetical protein